MKVHPNEVYPSGDLSVIVNAPVSLLTSTGVLGCTVPFQPGVQSLVTSDLELNTRYVLSRVTRPIEQRAKEITEIYRKYLLQ
jgi:hypothetical protein